MNERIKQLYEQASIRYSVYETLKPQDERKIIPDIFAELIVRECEKVAKDGPWYYDAPSCGWRNPINFVCKEMKEHFGVE